MQFPAFLVRHVKLFRNVLVSKLSGTASDSKADDLFSAVFENCLIVVPTGHYVHPEFCCDVPSVFLGEGLHAFAICSAKNFFCLKGSGPNRSSDLALRWSKRSSSSDLSAPTASSCVSPDEYKFKS